MYSVSAKLPGGVMPANAGTQEVLAMSAEAARNAATHFHGWHATAVSGLAQGDGLSPQVDNMRLNDTQFPAEPYTGIVYTPPSYSDHVPVSVLFSSALLKHQENAAPGGSPCQSIGENHTRKAQPWKGQPSISAFFKTPAKTSSSAVAGPAAKRRKV